jgi:biotin transport system ATP-binding protein
VIQFDSAAFIAPTPHGEVQVLHPIHLTLTEQRIALIGANGSGKSSLARMINGLVEPSSGSVSITLAEPSATAPSSTASLTPSRTLPLDTVRDGGAVRRHVGFVFTDPSAQLVMPTVREDIALSLRKSHPNKAERHAAVTAVLSEYGLDHLAERSVHTLSGGQKQMLALASVLATRPAILVADEPTTLLDLKNSGIISRLLLSLPQQVIIATHDLALAARCERVVVIDGGRVAFDSAHNGDVAAAIAWYRASVSA